MAACGGALNAFLYLFMSLEEERAGGGGLLALHPIYQLLSRQPPRST